MKKGKLLQFIEYIAEYPNYRVGQAFCNFFSVRDTILFYETDPQKCWEMIVKNPNYYAKIDENQIETV